MIFSSGAQNTVYPKLRLNLLMITKILRCKIGGHRYEVTTNRHFQINEYRCKRCNKEFTDDGYGQKVPLTEYWRRNNNRFKTYLEENYS